MFNIKMDDFNLDNFDNPSTIKEGTDETSFMNLNDELLKPAVNDYHDVLKETPIGRDYSKFTIDSKGILWLRDSPDIDHMNSRTASLALSTIVSKHGINTVRNESGFVNYSQEKLSAKTTKVLQTVGTELGNIDNLEESSKLASDGLGKIFVTYYDNSTLQVPSSEFSIREWRGLVRAMQTMRGELINNIAKLSELNKHIAFEKTKLEQADDEFSRRHVEERLHNLEERSARLQAASSNKKALRSQISRIRETIDQLLNDDTTLADKIKTLFREQGITIASILTALGFIISTLTLTLTGGTGVTRGGTPLSDKNGVKEWIKKHLKALGEALGKLSGKAASALPGIIGSTVSWLFNL